MIKNWLLAIGIAIGSLMLSSCATQQGGGAPVTAEQQLADAQRTVYNLQQAYNGVLSVMLVYKRLPVCGSPGATQVCSKPDVVKQLQAADNVAFESLQAAQLVIRSPGAGANVQTALATAQAAMTALANIAATLPK